MRKMQKILGILLSIAMLVGAFGIGTAAAGLETPTGKAESLAVGNVGVQSCGATCEQVYVGGVPFGVKFITDGVLVVGFCDVEVQGTARNPAKEAGLRIKDVITKINGASVGSAADLTRAVENSNGKPLELTVKRKSGRGNSAPSEMNITVTPILQSATDGYKTGIWVRDSGAGIGTVTFILPSSKAFGGLGHGICDGDTGELIPMKRGNVTNVTISGIEKGVAGDPGAIKGYFNAGKIGSLVSNTPCGVYGVLSDLPSGIGELMTVASRHEVKEGAACVRCTLDTGEAKEYSVKISAIDTSASGSKCFAVTVTDPELIAKTGGIVQGMSGSPIIQNGKLIGAVTHVLVSDPTTGYGIFIENMLNQMGNLAS